MLMQRSTNVLGNVDCGRRTSPLIRLPSPPRSPNKVLSQKHLYLTGALTSQMYSLKLPPHHHYDHTIDLQPTFTPCIAKIYPLNPAKLQTCKEFIDEHLKTGRIVLFKSPQASLFFFIPKKDGFLCPCQGYQYLNSHTVRNVYPLLLIPELINDMKDATLFMKFDIQWGYNNIHICKEDQWKATFITPL